MLSQKQILLLCPEPHPVREGPQVRIPRQQLSPHLALISCLFFSRSTELSSRELRL